jgi:hypothetical protein
LSRGVNKHEKKKIAKKDENVFYCPFYQRKKCSQSNSHGKIKAIDRYLQHICAHKAPVYSFYKTLHISI